jgi:hypothetical protein
VSEQEDTPTPVLQFSVTNALRADAGTAGEAAGLPVVARLHVLDTVGELYHIDYFHFPGPPQDSNRQNLEDSCMSGVRQSLEFLGPRVFPNYDEQMLANWIRKFDTFSRLDLVYTAKARLVAFHIYKMGVVQNNAGSIKVVYVEHSGTDPDYEGRGLTRSVRTLIFDRETPNVICGSSANGAIYLANERIAEQRAMVLYPRDAYTPTPVVVLANQIHDALGLRNAALDDRLLRTYTGPVSRGKIVHPLHDVLPLEETQHYFYMLLQPELNQALLLSGGENR